MIRRNLMLAAAIMVSLLLFASCGSDSDYVGDGEAQTVEATPEPVLLDRAEFQVRTTPAGVIVECAHFANGEVECWLISDG